MRRDWKRIVALLLSFTYFFQITAVMAATTQAEPTSQSSSSSTNSNTVDGSYDPTMANSLQNLNINSENLGLSGPLSLGVNYDTLVNTVLMQRLHKKLHLFLLWAPLVNMVKTHID